MERSRTMRHACALFLFHVVCLAAFSIVAAPAVAQTITVNGSSSALEINRGVTIAVAAGGGSAACLMRSLSLAIRSALTSIPNGDPWV